MARNYLTVIFHYIFNDTKCDVQSIQVILPGPSSTERGLPVLRTGSPTVTPAVNIIHQGIKTTASFPSFGIYVHVHIIISTSIPYAYMYI